MKLSQSVVLVSVFFISLSSYALAAQPCSALNPFLPVIGQKGVQLKASPSPSPVDGNNKCSFEWSVHGTCCDYTSLVTYAKADSKKTDDGADKVANAILNIQARMVALQKTISILKNQPLFMKNRKTLSSLHKFIQNMEPSVSPGIKKYLIDFSGADLDATRCMNAIKQARSGSLCSICSGRSSKWFSGSKALISNSQCSGILSQCGGMLLYLTNYMVNFRTVLQQMSDAQLDGLTVAGGVLSTGFLRAELRAVVRRIDILKVGTLIIDYVKSSTVANTNALCESFVNLVHTGLVESLGSVFTLAYQFLHKWILTFEKLPNFANTADKWTVNSRSRRVLQGDVVRLDGDVLAGKIPDGPQSSSQSVAVDSRFIGLANLPIMNYKIE